jgi:hypothetical protein
MFVNTKKKERFKKKKGRSQRPGWFPVVFPLSKFIDLKAFTPASRKKGKTDAQVLKVCRNKGMREQTFVSARPILALIPGTNCRSFGTPKKESLFLLEKSAGKRRKHIGPPVSDVPGKVRMKGISWDGHPV